MTMVKDICTVVDKLAIEVREAVGRARLAEHCAYIRNLKEAKEAGLDLDMIALPMISDNVVVKLDAGLVAKTDISGSGGISWSVINIGLDGGKESREALRVGLEMQYKSIGAPDIAAMKLLTVAQLDQLLSVLEEDESETEDQQ